MYYKILKKRFVDLFKLTDTNERSRDFSALKNLK